MNISNLSSWLSNLSNTLDNLWNNINNPMNNNSSNTNTKQKQNKKNFKRKIDDLIALWKATFSLINQYDDLKKPLYRLLTYRIINIILIFSVITILIAWKFMWLLFLLIPILCIMNIHIHFFKARKEATAWAMVYDSITWKEVNFKKSSKEIKEIKWSIRIIWLIDWLMSSSKNKEPKGFKRILFAVLNEVWDLVNHFLIPAVAIEKKSVSDVIWNMKNLRNNIPATLVGVFWIDFIWDVVNRLLFPIGALLFLITGWISFAISYFFDPVSYIIPITNDFNLTFIPFVVIFFIFALCSTTIKALSNYIKVIYFSVFYVSVNKPVEIVEEWRDQLTNYLLLPNDEAIKEAKQDEKIEDIDPKYLKLAEHIKDFRQKWYSEAQIKEFMLSKWMSEDDYNKWLEVV